MQHPAAIDPDLLRAFIFIAEEGSFTRAAERVGRTQSAVSMQVQRLEGVLGQKLLLRGKGGGVQLTPHGQYLLERARELLVVNDEIWGKFRTPQVHGTVRLGTPDDYALRYLPQVLKRFADTHPAVEVEVFCAPSDTVVERLRAGELDLTLCSEGQQPPDWPCVELWQGPLGWVTSERYAPHRLDPMPLAIASDACLWGRAARTALEQVGRRWRVAYTSASMTGTFAPVMAGLAVTVSANTVLPDGLRLMRADEGMPKLPHTGIVLLQAREARQPVTEVLAAHITETFGQELRRQDNRN